MTQQTACFDAFVPFLQEITNISTHAKENKENIPPSLNRSIDSQRGEHGRCVHRGLAPPPSASFSAAFDTPVANRQRPRHTGLTPGNTCASPGRADTSVMSEGADSCCLLPAAIREEMGLTGRPHAFGRAPSPIAPRVIFAEDEEERRLAPTPLPLQTRPSPPLQTRPPVTRVVSAAAPLIAVGGRRVPADKLHLLLRTNAAGRDASGLMPSARPTPTAVRATTTSPTALAPLVASSRRFPPQYSAKPETVVLEFGGGVLMRFQPTPSQPLPVLGRRYVAAITSSRSPYDNVAYEDAGLCVCVQHHHADGAGGERTIYDGVIRREVQNTPSDCSRMAELRTMREAVVLECVKHFRFLNLPFVVEDVHCSFDQTLCVVYYRIKPEDGTSSQPNIPRLLRMLQFRLRCKVYLRTGVAGE